MAVDLKTNISSKLRLGQVGVADSPEYCSCAHVRASTGIQEKSVRTGLILPGNWQILGGILELGWGVKAPDPPSQTFHLGNFTVTESHAALLWNLLLSRDSNRSTWPSRRLGVCIESSSNIWCMFLGEPTLVTFMAFYI